MERRDDTFLLRVGVPVPGAEPPAGTRAPAVSGRVCLEIKALTVDPVTGDDVAVDNLGGHGRERHCLYVVPPPPPPVPEDLGGHSRPPRWWTLWTAAHVASPLDRVEAYVDADAVPRVGPPPNLLLHHVGAVEAVGSLDAVLEGAAAAERPEAGLLVVIALTEDLLVAAGDEVGAHLARAPAGVAVMVTVDRGGGWAASAGIAADAGAATRLISPDGRVAWEGRGDAGAAPLADALREHLVPAPPPEPAVVSPALPPGTAAPDLVIDTPDGDRVALTDLRGRPVTLAFVTAARPCRAALGRLERTRDQAANRDGVLLALVGGVGPEDAARLQAELGLGFPVVADPHGELAARFAVRAWPTVVTLDPQGVVADVRPGADPGAREALARRAAAAEA